MVLKVKTDIFKHFKYGDILYPVNNGNQYALKDALPGDNCLSYDFIEKNSELFEKVSDDLTPELKQFIGLFQKAKRMRLLS